MTRAVLCVIATTWLFTQANQQPTFRARTDMVRVDALVVRDGRPVNGLPAEAFEVRDNGVLQRVVSVTAIGVVNLGVVLDVSGSMEGARLSKAQRAFRDLQAQLEKRDHYVALAFGDQVAAIANSSMPAGEASARLEAIRPGGSTALVDAAYAGILQSDVAAGPKLLLLMTDGRNNASWLRARAVTETARRHETVIYPVAVGVREPNASGWKQRNDSLGLLKLLASDTGGRVVESDWDADLGEVFGEILREYRQRYILGFTPEGVGRGDGWHTLDVKLRRGRGAVRARRTYWAGE
jgi:Ca-activated chloride channel homolog